MDKVRFAAIGTNITDTFLKAAEAVPESLNNTHRLTLDVMEVLDEVRRQTGVSYECDQEEYL